MPRKNNPVRAVLPARSTTARSLPLPRSYPLAGTEIRPMQIHAIPERHPRGHGPWTEEPDRVAWRDAKTGFDCLVLRQVDGTWGGYVAVPPTHPLSGHRHDAVPASIRRTAHRGLCYSEQCDPRQPEALRVCHVELVPPSGATAAVADVHTGESAWWFGFECNAPGDLVPDGPKPHRHLEEGEVYRDINYVAAETLKLAEALRAIDASGLSIDASGSLAAPNPRLGKPS